VTLSAVEITGCLNLSEKWMNPLSVAGLACNGDSCGIGKAALEQVPVLTVAAQDLSHVKPVVGSR
jgi:hypothetical protein